jgi:hypothetical protein
MSWLKMKAIPRGGSIGVLEFKGQLCDNYFERLFGVRLAIWYS